MPRHYQYSRKELLPYRLLSQFTGGEDIYFWAESDDEARSIAKQRYTLQVFVDGEWVDFSRPRSVGAAATPLSKEGVMVELFGAPRSYFDPGKDVLNPDAPAYTIPKPHFEEP